MTPPLASFPSPPSALRKKDSLLSYHSQQSQEPSTSGASIRSSSTSKSFGTTLLEAYHEWKEADEALQRLHLEERDRDECAIELAAAKEVVGKLKADRYVDHPSITRSMHSIDHRSVPAAVMLHATLFPCVHAGEQRRRAIPAGEAQGRPQVLEAHVLEAQEPCRPALPGRTRAGHHCRGRCSGKCA